MAAEAAKAIRQSTHSDSDSAQVTPNQRTLSDKLRILTDSGQGTPSQKKPSDKSHPCQASHACHAKRAMPTKGVQARHAEQGASSKRYRANQRCQQCRVSYAEPAMQDQPWRARGAENRNRKQFPKPSPIQLFLTLNKSRTNKTPAMNIAGSTLVYIRRLFRGIGVLKPF